LNNEVVAGASPDPNGVWVIDLSPLSLLSDLPYGFADFVDFGIGNSADAGIYYPSGYPAPVFSARVFGPIPSPSSSITPYAAFSGPSLAFRVADLKAVCPSMGNPGVTNRIYIQNSISNNIWIQMAAICVAYYVPSGFLA
jgi:hypothetical protein